jgi:type IV pilus modification protein PilV
MQNLFLNQMPSHKQRGVFLLEALIAILIFAFGILGIVALGATAINAQSDAEYRTEAANLASEIVGNIAANVKRDKRLEPKVGFEVDVAALASFEHQPGTGTALCEFSGSASSEALVSAWADRAGVMSATNKALPGATDKQQIIINVAENNRVTVTVCWKAPNDAALRRHTLVAYIN